jgi:hypothetical protein
MVESKRHRNVLNRELKNTEHIEFVVKLQAGEQILIARNSKLSLKNYFIECY